MNEWLDVVWSFLGTGAALALGFAALKYLAAGFIEHRLGAALQTHQHGLDIKLARLEVDLGRVSAVLSRRNEREFAVIEKAWELMMRAFGSAQANFLWPDDTLDLVNLEEADSVALIDGLPFSVQEKQVLKSMRCERRQRFYETVRHRYRTVQVQGAWAEFKNCLTAKQIFMTERIYSGFLAVAHELSDHTLAVASAQLETGDPTPPALQQKMEQSLQELDQRVDALGAEIRSRFGFDDEAVR